MSPFTELSRAVHQLAGGAWSHVHLWHRKVVVVVACLAWCRVCRGSRRLGHPWCAPKHSAEAAQRVEPPLLWLGRWPCKSISLHYTLLSHSLTHHAQTQRARRLCAVISPPQSACDLRTKSQQRLHLFNVHSAPTTEESEEVKNVFCLDKNVDDFFGLHEIVFLQAQTPVINLSLLY